ncbi:MAG: flagellar filament capping protein FliD [candidate division Zixibacteria bacterium]|nr:flagellar filament capping protein FliD [candidate division Zixibacteria bacterium]
MAYAGAIDGIISGLDTTKIIETMLKIDQQKISTYETKQTEQTNKLTSWQSINALLLAFKTQASLLANDKLWYAKSVVSSDEDIMTATSSTDASAGEYYFSVQQLATNNQIASQGFNLTSQSIGTGTFQIKLGSGATTNITIDSSNNTLSGLKDAINNANAGVTATIISDGSETNQYRMILTAKEPGLKNQISVTANLSGGIAPDFSTPQFDTVEKLAFSGNSTSNPLLSPGVTYTGAVNKTYTFTVGGTGLQTVGTGTITIDWTDGTNSGSFEVTAADTNIALTGPGADGLSLQFSQGTLNAGDTFQVQAFAPTIQKAQNAIVRLGTSDSGSSPITISSSTNTISDIIQGVTLNLKSVTDANEKVKISVSADYSQIKSQINSFVSKFNDYQKFVDEQFSYEEGGTAGVLLGDGSLLNMHNDIRASLTTALTNRSGSMRMLSQAGIKFDSSGKLTFDESIFNEKIEKNFSDLVKLFKSDGTSDKSYIEYVSSTAATKVSSEGYAVDITKAAARGYYRGVMINNPSVSNLTIDSSNNKLKVKINNTISELITLDSKIYSSGTELAQDIEDAINGDSKLGSLGVDVEWMDNGDTGYLIIYTQAYGSKESVTIESDTQATAHSVLGLTGGVAQAGADVEGTINGEPAKGVGQILTGNSGNKTTDGLKLRITATPDQIVSGAEGTIYFNKGIAALIDDKLSRYTDSYNGIIKVRTDSLQKTIDRIASQIDEMEAAQERKKASLYEQFQAMESALAELQATQQELTAYFGTTYSSASKSGSSS